MNEFQRLLASLILFTHNTKILHWKIGGVDFDPVHEKLGSYYALLDGLIDEIAEIGMQFDINPVGLFTALQLLETDTGYNYLVLDGTESFDSKKAFENIQIMFTSLLSLYEKACSVKIITSDVVNKLEEHMFIIRKELSYKNKQRLI